MNKSGYFQFFHEKATTEYSYQWKFSSHINNLKEWAKLNGKNSVELEGITFDSGILQKTKHSMQAIFVIDEGALIIKFQMGNPSLHGNFTHSKIKLKKVGLDTVLADGTFGTVSMTTPAEKFIDKHSLQNESTEDSVTVKYYSLSKPTIAYYAFNFNFTFEHVYWSEKSNMSEKLQTSSLLMNVSPAASTIDTKSLYESKYLSDFLIICGVSSFKAHKIVLAMQSPVFDAMFNQPMSESIECEMTIIDTEPKSLEEFLKFLYTGTADFENEATELFILGDKYGVENLKQISEHYLINSVNVENVFDLYKFGKLYNSENLMNKCHSVFKSNKKDILKTPDDVIWFVREFPIAYEIHREIAYLRLK